MYLKNSNGVIVYPYSLEQLRQDNPDVSFPLNPSVEILNGFDVYECVAVEAPTLTYKNTLAEDTPELIDGVWTQKWIVGNKSADEITGIEKALRAEAYREESDPIFFKAQRGEATNQDWLDKVAEIKARYSEVA